MNREFDQETITRLYAVWARPCCFETFFLGFFDAAADTILPDNPN